MHLLHLSAQAHSGSAAPSSAALVAQSPMGPLSHNLATDAMISHQAQGNQSVPMAGLSTPAAPTMTNPVYGTQSTDSPPVMVNHAQANNEAAQLPTPETMIDQSKAPLFFLFPFSVIQSIMSRNSLFYARAPGLVHLHVVVRSWPSFPNPFHVTNVNPVCHPMVLTVMKRSLFIAVPSSEPRSSASHSLTNIPITVWSRFLWDAWMIRFEA